MKNKLANLCRKYILSDQAVFFPLCIVFSSMLNLVLFYLGFAYEENMARNAGFIVGSVLFAVFCGIALLAAFKKGRLPLRKWLLLGVALLLFVCCYGAAFLRHGLNGKVIHYAEQFIVFCVPAFFAGILGAINHGERTFFSTLESLSFLVFPGALIYFNSTHFDCLPWNYGANLGILNYMVVAYTFMPFLLAHIVSFAEKTDWILPFSGRKIQRPQLLRGIFIAIYWASIIASATRGAYVCVAGFCVLWVLMKLIHRDPALKPAFLVSAAMAALLLFNLFIYAPPGLYRIQRMNTFLDNLMQHQFSTGREDPTISEHLDTLVEMGGSQQVVNNPETPDNVPADSPSEGTDNKQTDISTFQLQDRGTLFKLAIKEFQKSPLTGIGPMGYTVKYGEYPHNAILEILCETGLIGTLVLLGIICYVFIKLLLMGWKDKQLGLLFLFFVAYAIRANISGSVWICQELFCALGYGIAMPGLKKEQQLQDGKESHS